MAKLSGLCALLAALSHAVAAVKVTPAYFFDGGELRLNVTPAHSEGIANILWKFRGNLLAEWIRSAPPLELYGTFTGRTDLDTVSGTLVVRRMSKADTGAYTVEINSKVHGEGYDARMIEDLSKAKVEVVLRPLTCNSDSEKCNVSCEVDIRLLDPVKPSDPVTYSWRIGDGGWVVSKKDVEITKAGNADDETITCRVSNPLSEGVSEPIDNPFYHSTVVVVVVVVVVSLLLAVCAAVVVVVLKKKEKFCFKNQNSNSKATTNPQGEASAKPPEEHGLTEKSPDDDV